MISVPGAILLSYPIRTRVRRRHGTGRFNSGNRSPQLIIFSLLCECSYCLGFTVTEIEDQIVSAWVKAAVGSRVNTAPSMCVRVLCFTRRKKKDMEIELL